ncbi:MAG: AAA family ATPase [Burkholderiaceae bacterium]
MTHGKANATAIGEKALSIHDRSPEIQQVSEMLNQSECQLVTLAGPAGIGKTCLAKAIAAAAPMQSAFLSFADTESVTTATSLAQIEQILTGLGHGACSDAAWPALLVIDGLDELTDRSSILSQVLSGRPMLKVLATSRYPLELPQEWALKVRGLEFRKAPDNADGLTSAAEFFVKRVLGHQQSFDPAPHRRTINVICARLEGSPLAIELAADAVGRLSVVEIAKQLCEDFDFLRARDQSRPARQASLRGAMDSCWDQLTPEERSGFAHLSLFAGGFCDAAAREVACCDRKTLARLVERSWLRLECTRTATRYLVHPLLRRYGLEKLSDATTQIDSLACTLKRKHAQFYGRLLCEQADALNAVDDESFYQVDLEHQNLRLAWAWLKANPSDIDVIGFVNTLHLYCIYRNHRHEAAALLESALTLPDLPHEQVAQWQHLRDETRLKAERIHGAERRCLPRLNHGEATLVPSRRLTSLTPPPQTRRPNLVRL